MAGDAASIHQYQSFVLPLGKTGVNADCSHPAANTAAEVSYAAPPAASVQHAIDSVLLGYDGVPAGGLLTVSHGAGDTVLCKLPIVEAGPQLVKFDPPLIAAVTTDTMKVTLSAGGAGIKGYLNVRHRLQPV